MENLTSKQKIILLILGIIVIGMFIFYITTQTNIYTEVSTEEIIENENTKETEIDEEKQKETNKIIIHITGAVNKEGVVELEEGERIQNAVEKAGGLTEEADLTNVNLAYQLKDGQKVYIPKKSDKEKIDTVTEENGKGVIVEEKEKNTENSNKKININTATKEQLETLSGIGTETAQKIIDYRQLNGKFKSIEEIKNVSGIGSVKYENIKNDITV